MSVTYKRKETQMTEKDNANKHENYTSNNTNNFTNIDGKVCPKCYICGRLAPGGLYDGFRLSGKFVCSICENKILLADSTDDTYEEMKEAIKKVLLD